MHGNHINSPKERDANNISNNGFDTPFVHKSSVVSPPSPSRFSWIKRCTELIFNHSSEKLHTDNGDKVVVSDASNLSKGQKYLKNGKQLGGKRQQKGFSCAEPKVILEVPSPAKHINRMSDSESEIKKNVYGKIVPLLSDGCRVGRLKRGGGNLGNEVGDPFLRTRQHKKLRPNIQPIESLLDQGATCSAIPSQSNVSKVHELSILSNQTHGNTEDTRVVMVDKVLHVSEMTSVKVDCIVVPKQEVVEDHLHNHTTGVD